MFNIIKDLFRKSLEEEAMKKLQDLSKKFIIGLSTDDDLKEWEENLVIVKRGRSLFLELNYRSIDIFISEMENTFMEYKLKHYPNKALSYYSHDIEDFRHFRTGLYIKMLILALGEFSYIIDTYDSPSKDELIYLKREINEYILVSGRITIELTDKCKKCSNEVLKALLNRAKLFRLDFTPEQKEWHIRVHNLDTFKVKNMKELIITRYIGVSYRLKKIK